MTLIDRLYDVEQDMAADLQEAVDLEKAIIEHEEPLHLAEQRARQRYKGRPKSERVRDSAEKALEQEVEPHLILSLQPGAYECTLTL